MYMSGSVLTNIAGERGIRELGSCSDQKAGNLPDWQEQPGQLPRTQMPLHSIQMLPRLSLWPWHKLECLRGLAVTDNQHLHDGMTTFVTQLLPANDIPVPQPPSGRIQKYIASL